MDTAGGKSERQTEGVVERNGSSCRWPFFKERHMMWRNVIDADENDQ